MMNFDYHVPTKILFGKNKIENLGKEIKNIADNILLVYGTSSIKKSGLYETITSILKENDISFKELSGILPNPRIKNVRKGVELCKKHSLKFILAVGGGSVIDASKASYVVGSSKAGTMSMTSKYAFANKADAEAFAKEFGGKVMNFDDTLASVDNSLHKDCKMMRKKQAKMAQKGEMMYKKMCKPIDAEFNSVAEAKSYLKSQKPCGDIKGKQLQAIGIYLNSRNK